MRIDSGINYSSFMQHYNMSDIRPTQTPSAEQASQQKTSVSNVSQVNTSESNSSKSDGQVFKAGGFGAVSGRSPYKNTAVQDIEIDFSAASSSNQFSGNTSGVDKDSMLREYCDFIGGSNTETLVNNSDGMVLKLN